MDLTDLRESDLHEFLDAQIAARYPASEMPFSTEQAASRLARLMCEECIHDGRRSLVLARVFQSLPFCDLPVDISAAAVDVTGGLPQSDDLFLVLLGTCGKEVEWRDRRKSKSYKAIPLKEEMLTDEILKRRIPMLSRALQQVGVDLKILMGPERLQRRTYRFEPAKARRRLVVGDAHQCAVRGACLHNPECIGETCQHLQ